ncbi:unnamed protein product [Cyprideis torosa]|uniref:Uncharacterized protein n=1 Tax=Cyprideis torosa TaxID=163714 RepID=A0A7R8W3H9_9CRUS|nr:unnamed protein product [Cyprideis torosa]CAG0878896.1 unnamed protein product [Cyprideis torosa]
MFRMKAPSFFCENETRKGCTLHYRSKRRGFVNYVQGQITEVGTHFYNTKIKIDVLKEEVVFDTIHVTFNLEFDNKGFGNESQFSMSRDEKLLPVPAHIFLDIFPFSIIFSFDKAILYLVRILNRRNNIFELMTSEPISRADQEGGSGEKIKIMSQTGILDDTNDDENQESNLHLKDIFD